MTKKTNKEVTKKKKTESRPNLNKKSKNQAKKNTSPQKIPTNQNKKMKEDTKTRNK
jgi:hypothetical protein